MSKYFLYVIHHVKFTITSVAKRCSPECWVSRTVFKVSRDNGSCELALYKQNLTLADFQCVNSE